MAFLDWAFETRYENEARWLEALREHTESWHNEIVQPLAPVIHELEAGGPTVNPEEYGQIAQQLFFSTILSNHGDYVSHTVAQMGTHGIPLFTSRPRLVELTAEYLEAGDFVKQLSGLLSSWSAHSADVRQSHQQEVLVRWRHFRASKDTLVEHINKELRRLG
jgi:hypothetical protein